MSYRSIHPRMPLNPGLAEYKLRLTQELPRIVLAWSISLMPGTASVHYKDNHIIIHLLTQGEEPLRKIHDLETRIAALFGIDLPPEK